ncbi:hypothetical protein AAHC03_019088 [Spirometra sp. Aus1]
MVRSASDLRFVWEIGPPLLLRRSFKAIVANAAIPFGVSLGCGPLGAVKIDISRSEAAGDDECRLRRCWSRQVVRRTKSQS